MLTMVMANIAHHVGNNFMTVKPMVRWPKMTRQAADKKMGRRGNRRRKSAAKRPPGILTRDIRKLIQYLSSAPAPVPWKLAYHFS